MQKEIISAETSRLMNEKWKLRTSRLMKAGNKQQY